MGRTKIAAAALALVLTLGIGCATLPRCEEFMASNVQVGQYSNQMVSGWACPTGGNTWEAHKDLPLGDLFRRLLRGW